ncbi:MAG: hypothetical protein Q9201_007472 [Fulgogasparrea decipioides]
MSDQEAMQWLEEAIDNGELSSQVGLDTTYFDLPKDDPQIRDVSNDSTSEWSTNPSFLQSFGAPVQLNDFALFDTMCVDDFGQSVNYPSPDMIAAPGQPYFGNSPDVDFLQERIPSEDQTFWNSMLNESRLGEDETNQTFPQKTQSSQQMDANDIWNSLPALDELPPADLSAQFSAPPLPLHSKPSPGPSSQLQAKHFGTHQAAPVAAMQIQRVASPQLGYLSEGNNPTAQTAQRGQKRKAASPRPESSSDEEIFNIPADKKRKMNNATAKMAYVQGMPKQLPPDQPVNPRTTAIHHFDASQVYTPLPTTPANWSIFQYTPNGELQPGRQYSAPEINEYLFNHPLHTLPNGTYAPKHGGLRLWIQRNPSDSARRYPSAQSNRCRFAGCFATNNVINQGHIRVCFDEQSGRSENGGNQDHNPFHCAGFVHLNCLERYLDFPHLCATLPIMAENRYLPREPMSRNRMLLSPESNAHIVSAFIRDCETGNGVLQGYPRRARPHEGSLAWRLMSNKVEEERCVFERQREERGGVKGSQLTVHLGDLEQESRVRDLTRKVKYQVPRKRG